MFRTIVRQRNNLDQRQVADFQVLSASISEDLTQKATSKITCLDIPSNVNINDLLRIYDSKGKFIYWGVINSIKNNEIQCNQFASLYNSELLVLVPTSTTEKNFYKNNSISTLLDYYLKAKEGGYVSTKNTSLVFNSLVDLDVKNDYKNISHTIEDSGTERLPLPLEKNVINLEDYIYETFNTYNRVIKPIWLTKEYANLQTYNNQDLQIHDYNDLVTYFRYELSNQHLNILICQPNGLIELADGTHIDFREKKLFDTYEYLSNVSVQKEDEDINTLYIYNNEGTTFRKGYTITNTGTIEEILTNTSVANRLGENKIKYVFDTDNAVLDIANKELPSLQYNHKIQFDINFGGEYKFEDFTLGQPIQFYVKDQNWFPHTVLSAWKYDIVEGQDEIQNATFTLGKVRNDLTSRINKMKKKR